jgi:hypothetical protein
VGGHEDGGAFVGELPEEVDEEFLRGDVDSRERLVEEEQAGVLGERAGDEDAFQPQ